MIKYIAKRLIQIIPMVLIVSIVAFILIRIVPADAVRVYLNNAKMPINQENIAIASAKLGLDKPIIEQYILWLKDAITLNFGTSYLDNSEVFPKLVYSFGNTMELTLYTLVWIVLMVIPMGIFAARKENGIMDRIGRTFSLIGVAIPTFVLSYIFIRIFCIKLGILPVSGKESILHSILPSFTLALSYAATYSRMLRNNMLSNMQSRFVTYGRVRGLKESYIINKHVLRNAILPVVGSFGVSFGRLVAGSVIIENIFAWPGLGRLIVSAVLGRDYPMIQGYIVFMAILFIIANLLSDIISALVDPRIRLGSD